MSPKKLSWFFGWEGGIQKLQMSSRMPRTQGGEEFKKQLYEVVDLLTMVKNDESLSSNHNWNKLVEFHLTSLRQIVESGIEAAQ